LLGFAYYFYKSRFKYEAGDCMKKIREFTGQELVEFALILPLMLVILVGIAEMGFMWTLRGTVADAVKSSIQRLHDIAGSDAGTVQATLQDRMTHYLQTHGVPNATSLIVEMSDPNASDYTNIIVSYSYNPTFTLPNFFGIQLLPTTVTMSSQQVVSSALLRPNNYGIGDNTNFPTAVDPLVNNSILINDPTPNNSLRKQIAFLVDLPGNIDKIVNWWGHDILPGNAGVNLQDGTVWIRSPYQDFSASNPGNIGWGSTGESYAPVLLANGYSIAIYVDGSAGANLAGVQLPGPLNIYEGEMGSALTWCNPPSSGLGGIDCNGDLSNEDILLTKSFYNIGKGYEVLAPAPSSSPIDQVTLPSGDLVSDQTFREVAQADAPYASVKFYYPKNLDGTKFNPPLDGEKLDNVASINKMLAITLDADGDGIPNFWDLKPLDPDDNKDMIIDGHNSGSVSNFITNATNKDIYQVYGWNVDGKTGDLPLSNVTVPSPNLVANQYVTPAAINGYASAACAGCTDVASCTAACNNEPYFLKVVSEYTTNTGEPIKMKIPSASSVYYGSEKYIEPDDNKKIYVVQVFTRDFNHNGVYEPAIGGVVSLIDDDGDDNGINNASTGDTLALSDGLAFTKGLLFVDNTTGGASFNMLPSYTSNDPTLGYNLPGPPPPSGFGNLTVHPTQTGG
jgi:hypothetical protein